MIVRLLAAGKCVGISANSHKVIGNLLGEVLVAASGDVEVRPVQKVSEGRRTRRSRDRRDQERRCRRAGHRHVQRRGRNGLALGTGGKRGDGRRPVRRRGGPDVARERAAMSGAAGSIVLLGDPQQLDQPLQGSHPPGADRSALAHLLGEHDAMPDTSGSSSRTLATSPHVTTFTRPPSTRASSRRGRTSSVSACSARSHGRGRRPAVPIDTLVPTTSRRRKLTRSWRSCAPSSRADRRGSTSGRTTHCVGGRPRRGSVQRPGRRHPARPPAEARVGTVDKFQGQEAPVSIYSMTSSSPEEPPAAWGSSTRGTGSTSRPRAQVLAVVVASPELLRVRARTPEQMRLANALCQFAELSGTTDGSPEPAAADQQDAQISALAWIGRSRSAIGASLRPGDHRRDPPRGGGR